MMDTIDSLSMSSVFADVFGLTDYKYLYEDIKED